MQESLSLSPNILTTSVAGRRMLKPYCNLHFIFPWISLNISGVHSDAWGPFLIAFCRSSLDQGGPVMTWIPSSKYVCRRVAASWKTDVVGVPKVPCFRKVIHQGGKALSGYPLPLP